RRCLLIAWRVTGSSAASCAIERREPSPSFSTRASRVGSPSAANTAAASGVRGARPACALPDMFADVLHLDRPAAFIHAERLGAAGFRDPVESGFGDTQQGSALRGRFEAELDQGRR